MYVKAAVCAVVHLRNDHRLNTATAAVQDARFSQRTNDRDNNNVPRTHAGGVGVRSIKEEKKKKVQKRALSIKYLLCAAAGEKRDDLSRYPTTLAPEVYFFGRIRPA